MKCSEIQPTYLPPTFFHKLILNPTRQYMYGCTLYGLYPIIRFPDLVAQSPSTANILNKQIMTDLKMTKRGGIFLLCDVCCWPGLWLETISCDCLNTTIVLHAPLVPKHMLVFNAVLGSLRPAGGGSGGGCC